MRNKAVNLLEEIEANKLPSLPHVLVKLLQACRDENICFDSLSDIISQDATLTTKVIKAANSPVFGRARHLNSLKHTLMFLGFDTIKSIAITASIKQFFSAYNNEKTYFLKNFWYHSLNCATISRSLAELTSYPYPEDAYISGLLHDIGRLMIEPKMDDEYRSYEHDKYPTDQVLKHESDTVGISHPELAAIMLERWNLPDVICDAVRYHHASADNIQHAHQLAKIVNFSDLLTSSINTEDRGITVNTGIRLFDLSESVVNNIVKQSVEETNSLASSMDIDIDLEDSTASHDKDDLKQIQLAQEVRDIALIQNSQCIMIDGADDIYKTIQQSISLLFGINNSLFLTLDESQDFLTVSNKQHLANSSLFENLKIDISSKNTISNSLKNNKITDTFSTSDTTDLNIIDEQITRGLKTEGFISLPIIQNNQIYGALLLGSSLKKLTRLIKNGSLLELFIKNLCEKIQHHVDFIRRTSEISEKNNLLYLERASKIIHEVNNPLTVIKNYLQLLSQKLDDNNPAQSDIKTIKQEIDRVSNIIIRCKDDSGIDASELSEININTLITEIIDIYKASLFSTHKITTVLNLDKALKLVNLDENYIKQIISNLLKNAVEAIQSNGTITITSGRININGKNHIELRIEDNGPGIPPEVMKSLYTPVTTTKGENHSGLGLSITKNLVDSSGGTISCITSEKGTVFSVQFPVTK